MEISISERLGHITVRDGYDSIEGTAYNSRIASTEDCGVTTEMNAVSFPQLFGRDELGLGVAPCAIMASDCVDEDELYPYNYAERVRKDVSGAVLLTTSRRKLKHRGDKRIGTATMTGEDETELVVTMRRAAFVKLHKPRFPVSPFALQELHEGIARWGDVMLKTIRRRDTEAAAGGAAPDVGAAGATYPLPIPRGCGVAGPSSAACRGGEQPHDDTGKEPAAQRRECTVHAGRGSQESHPLYTKICLTKDWNERQKTLMIVRTQKLRNAYDFLMAPGRFVDSNKPHTSDQRYETSEGDICSWHLEAFHFPGVESLEQVWEALLFHYNNIEIGISERLGHTTVRDDYDAIDGSVYNTHVLSRSDNCIPLESSIVTFSHLFTEEDEGFGGHPCGILALDSVDEDELYPYFPNERVRLDTSGAIVLTANRRSAIGARKTTDGEEEDEVVVTLRRAAFLKLYNPQFTVSEATRQELQAGIGRWGDVLMKTIRSYEETSELKAEIRKLRSELELKSELKGLQTSVKAPPLELVISENETLSSVLQQQQFDIARVHSTLPPSLELHSLCTRICLKKSWAQRSAKLLSLREQKFRAAHEYITTRSQHSPSYSSDERFETANGDVCCSIFQTVHFPGVKSLKQVYDAVLFSMNNVEISICERLGHITTRDDYDCADSSIYNARMVSTNDMGITTEVSGIMFSRFFDSTDRSFTDTPCGMLVIDSVDEDELYPYVPSERVRKDVSAAFVLTADKPQLEGDNLVVTLRRAAFVKLHYPEFGMSEAVWQELQQDVARWGDVTTRAIRSVLYSVP
ncbi:hypothetical protein GQ600_3008 [Phytophthora cactorum]|nr:hypothetical protein GQ600_3008 [Phytophthora cactorum]